MRGYLFNERAYWRDPVQVFCGLTWFVVGGVVGFLIAQVAA